MKADIFVDDGFSPKQGLSLTTSKSSLPFGWDNKVSSICVTST
jgi:hypothetical protein